MSRSSINVFRRLGFFALCSLATAGCAGDDDAAPLPKAVVHIEIAGSFTSSVGGETETIDDTSWTTTYGFSTIVSFDNSARYAVLKDTGPNASFPNTFAYIGWTAPMDGAFYYCTANYNCPTVEEAKGATDNSIPGCYVPVLDSSDPLRGGCGATNRKWTKLTKQ